jgi:ferredoxin
VESPAAVAVIDVSALQILVDALRARSYTVIGPTVRDGAIVLAELGSAGELPYGWGVRLEPGGYRLRPRPDRAAFGHAAGPQSWKTYLHPARQRLWSMDRTNDAPATADNEPAPRLAFLGVRPCDLRAIGILDRVLAGGRHPDPGYQGRRDGVVIVAVECTEPGETCFCTSMGTGPAAGNGYDLALTEVVEDGSHRFLARVGTELGADLLGLLPRQGADAEIQAKAEAAVAAAADRMGRSMPPVSLPELMAGSREARRWEDVASRCLTCGNCTMVCPTCFCTTTEDVADLTGAHAERWQRWDSCFDLDFSYLHGGSVRTSGVSRYRQWMTHKLGTWYDQFGSSGCVGCGRCIVWCPVGIDITEEAAALQAEREAGP